MSSAPSDSKNVLGHGFDAAGGAHGHEDWGFDGAMGQFHARAAAAGGGGVDAVEGKAHGMILAG